MLEKNNTHFSISYLLSHTVCGSWTVLPWGRGLSQASFLSTKDQKLNNCPFSQILEWKMLPQQINSGYRLPALPEDSKFSLQTPDSPWRIQSWIAPRPFSQSPDEEMTIWGATERQFPGHSKFHPCIRLDNWKEFPVGPRYLHPIQNYFSPSSNGTSSTFSWKIPWNSLHSFRMSSFFLVTSTT